MTTNTEPSTIPDLDTIAKVEVQAIERERIEKKVKGDQFTSQKELERNTKNATYGKLLNKAQMTLDLICGNSRYVLEKLSTTMNSGTCYVHTGCGAGATAVRLFNGGNPSEQSFAICVYGVDPIVGLRFFKINVFLEPQRGNVLKMLDLNDLYHMTTEFEKKLLLYGDLVGLTKAIVRACH